MPALLRYLGSDQPREASVPSLPSWLCPSIQSALCSTSLKMGSYPAGFFSHVPKGCGVTALVHLPLPKGNHLNLEGVMSRAVSASSPKLQHRHNMGVPLKCRVKRPGSGFPTRFPFTESGQGKQNHGSRWRGMRLKEGMRELPSGSMVSGVERSDGHTVSVSVRTHCTLCSG